MAFRDATFVLLRWRFDWAPSGARFFCERVFSTFAATTMQGDARIKIVARFFNPNPIGIEPTLPEPRPEEVFR